MDIRNYLNKSCSTTATATTTTTPFKLAIIGSRTFSDYTKLTNDLNNALFEWGLSISDISRVISGGAKGADSLAERFALDNNIEITIYRPDWKKHGKIAGLMRNTDIINDSDYVIAFPSKNGRGTQDSIRKCKSPNKLKVIWID
jgi:YspA, cpYpsA-related SLOG family